MRIIDVDSHFHEPLDWFETANPTLAAKLPRMSAALEPAYERWMNLRMSKPAKVARCTWRTWRSGLYWRGRRPNG